MHIASTKVYLNKAGSMPKSLISVTISYHLGQKNRSMSLYSRDTKKQSNQLIT